MFKKFLTLPYHSIRVCIKGKRIDRGVGYGLQISAEYIFYGNERKLGGIDGDKEKNKVILKKISYFELVLCFL